MVYKGKSGSKMDDLRVPPFMETPIGLKIGCSKFHRIGKKCPTCFITFSISNNKGVQYTIPGMHLFPRDPTIKDSECFTTSCPHQIRPNWIPTWRLSHLGFPRRLQWFGKSYLRWPAIEHPRRCLGVTMAQVFSPDEKAAYRQWLGLRKCRSQA